MVSKISLLISFNIIIIFISYYYKKQIIIIFPFIFIFLITLYVQLHYKKNIEGFIDDNERADEIYSMWDNLNQDTYEDTGNELLEKINIFLRSMIEWKS
jgi:hypothetical protein